LLLETKVRGGKRAIEGSLTKRLFQECDTMLSAFENSQKVYNLKPVDCFTLFYRLGSLEFKDWKSLTDLELGVVKTSLEELESRLRTLLGSRKRDQLQRCFESGVLERLDEMRRDRSRILNLLAKKRLETTVPSIELNAILLSWLDYLGYALLLSDKLSLTLSPDVSSSITAVEADIKQLLPKIIILYRRVDDDPTPYPGQFPKSFWWRQL
jgi:hypothetical protein